MSDRQDTQTALSLEDLFLSREFGQSRAETRTSASPFGNGLSGGPLVPLTVGASNGFGHLTTTHWRRNRSLMATVSGAAAALLVALGVLTQSHNPATHFAIGGTTTPTTPTTTPTTGPTGFTGPTGGVTGTTSTGSVGSGTLATLAATVTGHSGAGGGSVGAIGGGGGSGSGSGGSGKGSGSGSGTSPTSPATPAPTSGNALAPVTTLVGHAVTTVGATATTASIGLGVTLPPAAPLTKVVGSLGGSLANLGNSLSGTAV